MLEYQNAQSIPIQHPCMRCLLYRYRSETRLSEGPPFRISSYSSVDEVSVRSSNRSYKTGMSFPLILNIDLFLGRLPSP